MRTQYFTGPALILASLLILGCAAPDREAWVDEWIAEMDATPSEERVPNWEVIRAKMVRESPRVGDPAPDFALETIDGDESVSLSQFRGSLPVVLIFGSWT